jgi:tetratricopeptide (TPR) repeat protein
VVLSWFIQITSGGIRRESGAAEAQPISRDARRRSDRIIIAVLAFAVTLFVAKEVYERIQVDNVEHLVDLGQKQYLQRTETSVVEAEKTFRQAIEFNPNSAEAYAGLANALLHQVIWGMPTAEGTRTEIRAAIDKGMELDHELGALHAVQGGLNWVQGDLDTAETFFLKAIELSPNDPLGYRFYAELFVFARPNPEKAIPKLEKALDLLPNEPDLVNMYGLAMRSLGKGVEALPVLRATAQLHQEDFRSFSHVAEILKYEQGEIGESLKWFNHIGKQNPKGFRRRFLGQCWAWLLFEDIDQVRNCTSKLEQDFRASPRNAMLARLMYYDATGDKNKIAEEVNALMDSGHAATVMQRTSSEVENATGLLAGMIPDVLVDRGMWKLAKEFREWQESPVFTDSDWEPSRNDINNSDDIVGAIINGAILYKNGNDDNGERLFDLALDRIRAEDLEDEAGFNFRQIFVLAVRGDKKGAEAYLRVTLLDKGHFEDWHRLRGPVFDSLKEEDEWRRLIAELEARAAEQREWYEKHKDEPLF